MGRWVGGWVGKRVGWWVAGNVGGWLASWLAGWLAGWVGGWWAGGLCVRCARARDACPMEAAPRASKSNSENTCRAGPDRLGPGDAAAAAAGLGARRAAGDRAAAAGLRGREFELCETRRGHVESGGEWGGKRARCRRNEGTNGLERSFGSNERGMASRTWRGPRPEDALTSWRRSA